MRSIVSHIRYNMTKDHKSAANAWKPPNPSLGIFIFKFKLKDYMFFCVLWKLCDPLVDEEDSIPHRKISKLNNTGSFSLHTVKVLVIRGFYLKKARFLSGCWYLVLSLNVFALTAFCSELTNWFPVLLNGYFTSILPTYVLCYDIVQVAPKQRHGTTVQHGNGHWLVKRGWYEGCRADEGEWKQVSNEGTRGSGNVAERKDR